MRDSRSEGVIRLALSDLGYITAQYTTGNVDSAAAVLANEKSPNLLVVDVSDVEDPAVSMRKLADVCDPHVNVIAIGTRNDVVLYRDLKNAGVAEYFIKPLFRELLTRNFNALLTPDADLRRPRTGKLVFLLGVRGGSGATTLATIAAWDLAEKLRRRTLLLDLDLQNGDAALQLDVAPTNALGEAFENPERIDNLYLDRAVKHVTDRLDLLASLEPLSAPLSLNEKAVFLLLQKVLVRYRFLIVDIPASVAVQLKKVIQLPSVCILVSSASLASARDVARWRKEIGPNTSDHTTLHILNRTTSHGGLPMADFEKAAGGPADVVIPYDREIAAATTLGIQSMHKCAVFNRGVQRVLGELTGVPVQEPVPLFRRIFG